VIPSTLNFEQNLIPWIIKLSRDQLPPKEMAPYLVRRYGGPFRVLEKIGNITYILELLFHVRYIHHVFHIRQLKSCRRDSDDPSQVEPYKERPIVVDLGPLFLEVSVLQQLECVAEQYNASAKKTNERL
jgi:hypothetical protein